MRGYKLLRLRKNGTLGPLFFNARQVIPVGEWLKAEHGIHKKGFKYRPGFHVTKRCVAPHLSKKGRVWVEVEVEDFEELKRPAAQGGTWLLAQRMRLLRVVKLVPFKDMITESTLLDMMAKPDPAWIKEDPKQYSWIWKTTK